MFGAQRPAVDGRVFSRHVVEDSFRAAFMKNILTREREPDGLFPATRTHLLFRNFSVDDQAEKLGEVVLRERFLPKCRFGASGRCGQPAGYNEQD